MVNRIVLGLLAHIENLEVKLDEEFGLGRSLEELLQSGMMPEAYYQAKGVLGWPRDLPVSKSVQG